MPIEFWHNERADRQIRQKHILYGGVQARMTLSDVIPPMFFFKIAGNNLARFQIR